MSCERLDNISLYCLLFRAVSSLLCDAALFGFLITGLYFFANGVLLFVPIVLVAELR